TPSVQTAGTTFNVTANAVDANWNVVNTNDTVAITSTDANAGLPANAALVSGTKNFSVTLKTAGNATLTASDTTHPALQNSTSPTLQILTGAFSKLQILAPGETTAPGSSNGKTGTPATQTAGTAFSVTLSAVDANWNVVSNISDTIGITSSDSNAALPANTALINGTKTLSVTFKTTGASTLTASNLTDNSKT